MLFGCSELDIRAAAKVSSKSFLMGRNFGRINLILFQIWSFSCWVNGQRRLFSADGRLFSPKKAETFQYDQDDQEESPCIVRFGQNRQFFHCKGCRLAG